MLRVWPPTFHLAKPRFCFFSRSRKLQSKHTLAAGTRPWFWSGCRGGRCRRATRTRRHIAPAVHTQPTVQRGAPCMLRSLDHWLGLKTSRGSSPAVVMRREATVPKLPQTCPSPASSHSPRARSRSDSNRVALMTQGSHLRRTSLHLARNT